MKTEDCILDFHQFVFNIKAVPQERARAGRNGFYIPKKSSNFKKEIKLLALNQWKRAPLDKPLFVEMIFKFKKPKTVKRTFHTVKPDASNLAKIVEDALNGVIWKDDSLICGLTISKEYSEFERIELNVFELKE